MRGTGAPGGTRILIVRSGLRTPTGPKSHKELSMETSLDPTLPPPARRGRTRLWLVSALTLAMLALTLGLFGWQLATGQDANPQAPPRISLSAFKTLYDDPAQRPLILD